MKKNILLLALFISLVVACSKDDNDDQTTNYVGTYTLSSMKTSVPIDSNLNGTFDDTELIDNISCRPKIILNANNIMVIEEFPFQSFDLDGSGGFINGPFVCEAGTNTAPYSITDGSLLITDGADTIVMSISRNKIVFIQGEDYITSPTDTTPRNINVTFTFTK